MWRINDRRAGKLSPVMKMNEREKELFLSRNAVGKGIVEAMTPEQRKLFWERVEALPGEPEKREYLNSLVGWQEGHPPYQC